VVGSETTYRLFVGRRWLEIRTGRGLVVGMPGSGQCQSHQRRNGLRPCPLHDRGTVVFESALADSKIRGDILGRRAGENQLHDLPLARSQTRNMRWQLLPTAPQPAVSPSWHPWPIARMTVIPGLLGSFGGQFETVAAILGGPERERRPRHLVRRPPPPARPDPTLRRRRPPDARGPSKRAPVPSSRRSSSRRRKSAWVDPNSGRDVHHHLRQEGGIGSTARAE